MSKRCGATSNGCNGKTGIYELDYVIPDPSYVRYRYAREAWQEVKNPNSNLTYRIDKVSQPGQGQGVRYRISVYTQADVYSPTRDGVGKYERTLYPYFGPPGQTNQFIGPITRIVMRRGDYFGSSSLKDSIRIQITHAGGENLFICQNRTGPNGSGIQTAVPSSQYWQLPVPPPDYPLLELKFFRVDNQPETERWRLQIFDALNNVVFNREDTTQPEATIVPEAYPSNPTSANRGSFRVSNRDPTKLLRVVRETANNRNSVSVFLGDTLIQKLESPLGATLFPRVCWDCEGDEKCPPGTCEVRCGNHICCYNSQGISVKRINK